MEIVVAVLVGLPLLAFVVFQAVLNFRALFWLMLAMIPLGIELFLPGGLATDFPTEPLAIGLTAVFALHAARHWPEYRGKVFLHPVAVLLFVHLAWILVSTLFAAELMISVKFTLAKFWYVGAFFLLPLILLDRPARVITFAHCVFWPLLFVALQTLARHSLYGFSFADQYDTMSPFMRNHVSYAGCLATFAPWLGFLAYARYAAGKRYRVRSLAIGLIWLLAIYFSFTRAAYISLILAAGAFLIVRYRLLRPALLAAGAVALATVVFLVKDNRYLDYAPNYDTTIAHERFDNLIAATYKLEDISTMERFYRWVAGGNMVPYAPWLGHGPGNFVSLYEGYTIDNFQTYVSDNPERSGIHNYYLMLLVEQGYPGLVLFLVLAVAGLLFAERAYHRQEDPLAKAAIMAAILSMIVVLAFSIINDLLETDKVGSLYFLALAITVTMAAYRSNRLTPTNTPTPPTRLSNR